MKDYDKNKEFLYLSYWEVNNLDRWAMSQKFPVDGFKWVEEASQHNEDFIKSYNEDSDEGYSLKIDVQCPEKLHEVHNDLAFLPKRMKIEKIENVVANLHVKKRICQTQKKFKTSIKSWISIEKSS